MIPMNNKKKGLVALIVEGKGRKPEQEDSEPSSEELMMDSVHAMMKALKDDDASRFHEALREWVDCYESEPHEEYEEEED